MMSRARDRAQQRVRPATAPCLEVQEPIAEASNGVGLREDEPDRRTPRELSAAIDRRSLNGEW